MAMRYGNELVIARDANGEEIRLSPDDRSRHFYVTGTTGSGKSKFLEGLIRQDIEGWIKSEYGILLLDWHGSIYDGLMQWLATEGSYMNRPILPIDLREDKWVVAYNFVRKRDAFYNSVLTDLMVQQLVYIWGQGDTNQTPNLDLTANTIFQAAIAEGIRLVDAFALLEDKAFRIAFARKASDPKVREKIAYLNQLSPSAFQDMTRSTHSRMQRLFENDHMRAALNQPGVSFDFETALKDNVIVLVSLAKGGRASKKDAQTFATLMLSDLWAAMEARGKPHNADDVKPFYTYIDEFQNFVSPTIVEGLDQARGFGLHATLAHQFPSQLADANPLLGKRLFNSVMMNTRNKAVFNMPPGTEHDLDPLNEWLFINTWDTEAVKFEQKTRGVIGYQEETRTVHGKGTGSGRTSGSGSSRSHTDGGAFGTHSPGLGDGVSPSAGPSSSEVNSSADGYASNDFNAANETESESESVVPVFLPIFGEQVASTTHWNLEELKHKTRKTLALLKDREGVIRLTGRDNPVKIRTPSVMPAPATAAQVDEYRAECLAKFPFVLPLPQAIANLALAQRPFGIRPRVTEDEEEEVPVARRRPTGKVKSNDGEQEEH